MSRHMTVEEYTKLEEEYKYRDTTLRIEIAREKMIAAQFGDRSENAEYKAAKQRYYQNNKRLGYLRRLMKSAKIISKTEDKNKVGLGDKVTIKLNGEVMDVRLVTTVGLDDIEEDMISVDSKVGKLIKGRAVSVVIKEEGFNIQILNIIKG